MLAWLEWDHPDMPWDATRLRAAPFDGRRLGPARLLAGSGREALVQPEWSPEGVLHVCSDRSGWWNLYRVGDGLEAICPAEAETGGPHWTFGQRYFAFRPGGGIIAARVGGGRAEAVAVADGAATPLGLGPVAGCPRPAGQFLAWISAPADTPPAILLSSETGVQEIRASGPAVLSAADISVAQAIEFPTADHQTGHAFWYPPANARFYGPSRRAAAVGRTDPWRPDQHGQRRVRSAHPMVDQPRLRRGGRELRRGRPGSAVPTGSG